MRGGGQAIAAVGAAHAPGLAGGADVVQGLHHIQAGLGAVVGADGLLPELRAQGLYVCLRQLIQQQCQPEAAQAMGAAAHQPIARAAITPADGAAGAEVSQGCDREEPLAAAAAVPAEQGAPIALEGFAEAVVDALHPAPGGIAGGYQGHRDPRHAVAAHGGEIGEVGRGSPPAQIPRPDGGIAEVHVLHQHIGVDHQLPAVLLAQQGGIVSELARRRIDGETPQQLPLAQVAQAHGIRRGA